MKNILIILLIIFFSFFANGQTITLKKYEGVCRYDIKEDIRGAIYNTDSSYDEINKIFNLGKGLFLNQLLHQNPQIENIITFGRSYDDRSDSFKKARFIKSLDSINTEQKIKIIKCLNFNDQSYNMSLNEFSFKLNDIDVEYKNALIMSDLKNTLDDNNSIEEFSINTGNWNGGLNYYINSMGESYNVKFNGKKNVFVNQSLSLKPQIITPEPLEIKIKMPQDLAEKYVESNIKIILVILFEGKTDWNFSIYDTEYDGKYFRDKKGKILPTYYKPKDKDGHSMIVFKLISKIRAIYLFSLSHQDWNYFLDYTYINSEH